MAISQLRFLQPIRSNQLYASYTEAIAAIDAIKDQLNAQTKSDGVSVIARYKQTEDGKEVIKTVHAIYHQTTNSFTYFVADVDKMIEVDERLDNLSSSITTDINSALDLLDFNSNSGTLVNVALTQENGKITNLAVTETNLNIKLAEVEASAKAAATTITPKTEGHVKVSGTQDANSAWTYTITEEDIASASALTEAQNAINKLNGEVDTEGSVAKAVNDAKLELLGDAAEEYNTLGKLEDKIQVVASAAKSYSIVKLTEEESSALGTNVNEAWKLLDEDSVMAGVPITIYKDSSLQSVELTVKNGEGNDGQFLKFTYILADGESEVVYLDVSTFLAESEFKNGLQVNNGVVSVKIDETNNVTDGFLKVDENGIYTEGIKDAIATAKSEAIQAIEDADYLKRVNLTVNGVGASVSINDNVQTSDVTIDGSKIELSSAYTEVSYNADAKNEEGNAIFTPASKGQTLDTAINAVETNVSKLVDEVLDNEKVTAEALTQLNASAGFDTNAKYIVNDEATYINDATSLADADDKLDAAIKAISDKVGGSNVSDQITNAIYELDYSDTAIVGQYVSQVSETNGVISVTREVLPTYQGDGVTITSSGSDNVRIFSVGDIDCGTFGETEAQG